MRALVQRVSHAKVTVDGVLVGAIDMGLCVFVGIKQDDSRVNAHKLADKVVQLRVFSDENGKMNRSVREIQGSLLVISQFTLYGDTSAGNRPSYTKAARPELARDLYETFVERCRSLCDKVEAGIFQSHMEVSLVNDGPVTLFCYSGE